MRNRFFVAILLILSPLLGLGQQGRERGSLHTTQINGVKVEYYVPPELTPKLSSDGKTLLNGAQCAVYIADPVPPATPIRIPPLASLTSIGQANAVSAFSITFIPGGETDLWGKACEDFPAEARAAFNAAAGIWGSLIKSSVPITIRAGWADLGESTLGYSGGSSLYRDYPGFPKAATWYFKSLADSFYGSDIAPSSFDMNITYNENFSWYFGTDGNTPAGQYDFMSVVLHEIAHGLNFAGSMSYSAGNGSWGYGTGYPNVYDTFTEDSFGALLTNTSTYPNPSTALGSALTSNSVWFAGPNAMAANGGQRVKIYAPTTWAGGSSYSHLDYSTFAGTANRLMVYAISSASSIHDPGPVTKSLLKDLGWQYAASTKAITAFNFNGLSPAVAGIINEAAHTVSLTVPFGTNVSALAPTITITGASVSPASGVSNNFTNPAIYTVTAEDATTQAYTITVTIAPNLVKSITMTAPNGGESWAVGSSHNVTWTSTGTIANVMIEYSTNSGSNYISVMASTANTGSYTWTVPNAPAATCLVRVSDASNSSINDVSNGTFTIRTGPSPALKNDFNGDGNEDILWRNIATGENLVWYMGFSGAGLVGSQITDARNMLQDATRAMVFEASGDLFKGERPSIFRDPKDGENPKSTAPISTGGFGEMEPKDIAKIHVTPAEGIASILGLTRIGGAYLLTVTDKAWEIAGTGDLNGDGSPDFVWRNSVTGEDYVWYMSGATRLRGEYLLTVADLTWQIVGTGDFNGDGNLDIVWRNSATGEDYVWYMNGSTRIRGEYLLTVADRTWQIVGTGDFNGDRNPDILWRNSATGEDYVWYMNGSTRIRGEYLLTVADRTWQIAGTGDFDGDGLPDILWRNSVTGENFVWYMNGAARIRGEYLLRVTDLNWKIVNR